MNAAQLKLKRAIELVVDHQADTRNGGGIKWRTAKHRAPDSWNEVCKRNVDSAPLTGYRVEIGPIGYFPAIETAPVVSRQV